jgi:acylglycerol lipase
MGGWTVLYYILKYPPTASTIKIAAEGSEPDVKPPGHGQGYLSRERSREDEKNRVQVAGAFVMCPMVEGGSIAWDIRS